MLRRQHELLINIYEFLCDQSLMKEDHDFFFINRAIFSKSFENGIEMFLRFIPIHDMSFPTFQCQLAGITSQLKKYQVRIQKKN